MTEIKVAKIVDASNLYCPVPIVKLSSAMKEIAVNDILEINATDPGVFNGYISLGFINW